VGDEMGKREKEEKRHHWQNDIGWLLTDLMSKETRLSNQMRVQRRAKKTVENIVKEKKRENKVQSNGKSGRGGRLQTRSEAEVKCGLQEAVKSR
jgi:hypothetical protein